MNRSPKKYKYLFGPVPSRRLGKSLGVDIVPMKTCSQNCLYCQLGKDAPQVLERKPWTPIDEVVAELKDRIDAGLDADHITISGSGEPTLHSELGQLIDRIRAITDIPVAVITNGTLLNRPDVRRDCARADVVLPSLDAGDEAAFRRINQPHPEIPFDTFIEGLCKFREEYSGLIWLEVFFCKGINTDDSSIEAIRRQIEKIRPDRIQLNTAVRPTAHREALTVDPRELQQIARRLGPGAEVIADFSAAKAASRKQVSKEEVLETLRRRPCTLEDLTRSLGIAPDQARAHLEQLTGEDKVDQECRVGKVFYSAR
jgi:wyosine [tRNA(Phe)-imidazoG37] synthetase (radical SAM superfamily)